MIGASLMTSATILPGLKNNIVWWGDFRSAELSNFGYKRFVLVLSFSFSWWLPRWMVRSPSVNAYKKKFLCCSQHIFACIEGKCFLLQIRTTRRAFYNIFVSQICCNLFFLNSTSMKEKVSLLVLLFFFLWKKWFVCASWMICDRLCCSKYLSRPFSRLLSPTTKSCTNKEPLLSSSNIVLTGEQNKLMSYGYEPGL